MKKLETLILPFAILAMVYGELCLHQSEGQPETTATLLNASLSGIHDSVV